MPHRVVLEEEIGRDFHRLGPILVVLLVLRQKVAVHPSPVVDLEDALQIVGIGQEGSVDGGANVEARGREGAAQVGRFGQR